MRLWNELHEAPNGVPPSAQPEPSAVSAPNTNITAPTTSMAIPRVYFCHYCGKGLSSTSNRSRHERNQHRGGTRTAAQQHEAPIRNEASDCAQVELIGQQQTDGDDLMETELFEPGCERTSSCDSETFSEFKLAENDSSIILANVEFADTELTCVPQTAPKVPADSDILAERDAAAESQCKVKLNGEILQQMVRPLMKESDLQQSLFPFLTWLAQPPVTSAEALVKARRIKSDSQMQPIKFNLRFIFAVLYERELIDKLEAEALVKITNCRALHDALVERNVGSSRIFVLFLLVKKILVFLSSNESVKRGVFTLPSSFESYMYVENICAEHGARRKQETRNRAVHGAAASSLLQRQLKVDPKRAPSAAAAAAPGAVSVPYAPTAWKDRHCSQPPLHEATRIIPSASAVRPVTFTAPTFEVDLDDEVDPSNMNSLSKEELRSVSQGCLEFLNKVAAGQETRSGELAESELATDALYVCYLVTATLCLGLAPRSQVLKQLQIGSSFVKNTSDGKFWVRILAEQSKGGKPTTFALPIQMTRPYEHYLAVVRPRILHRLRIATEQDHQFVFFKRNGEAPRSNFSSQTNSVTQRILGRQVNAHAFRAAVITAFYETGASQTQMNTLADVMAHDPTTARQYYYRPQFAKASVETNDTMLNYLLE